MRRKAAVRGEDLTGRVFFRLTVMRKEGRLPSGHTGWRCRCECGNECVVSTTQLRSGNNKSCGCLMREMQAAGAAHTTHGLSKTHPLYKVWQGMKKRCENPNGRQYPDYGARGIRVCERWSNDFEAFLNDVGDRPSPTHQIDRFPNNNGNYEPGNVRWATPTQNARNTRRNVTIEFRGETRCLSEWSEIVGLSYHVLAQRLYAGWSVDRALTEPHPARRRPPARPKVTEEKLAEARRLKAEGHTLKSIAEQIGISESHTWRIMKVAS